MAEHGYDPEAVRWGEVLAGSFTWRVSGAQLVGVYTGEGDLPEHITGGIMSAYGITNLSVGPSDSPRSIVINATPELVVKMMSKGLHIDVGRE